MGVNSLPKTVTRQRCNWDLNPRTSAPESSTLTTRLPSHPDNDVTFEEASDTFLLGTFNGLCNDTSDSVKNSLQQQCSWSYFTLHTTPTMFFSTYNCNNDINSIPHITINNNTQMCIIATMPSAKVKRYQNAILGTSGCSSSITIESQVTTSY